jgi:flagellar hook assembly protein FlgD
LSITDELIPREFDLYQNYPNPFNPITNIYFDIPTISSVNISIYDMTGRLVKILVDQKQAPGLRSVIWNGQNDQGNLVSAGVYLYQIHAGEFVQTKKMVLLK